MPIDNLAPPPKLALAPDWYVEAPKPPNFDENRPGLYEWRIEGKGSYIGQYRWISRPRREYGLNVARLINDLPYRKGKPDGFRRIHRELASALMEGRRIELVFLENGERPALNARETELIRERGKLNGLSKTSRATLILCRTVALPSPRSPA